jgi:hypothetical protein
MALRQYFSSNNVLFFAICLTVGIGCASHAQSPEIEKRQAPKECLRFPLLGVKVLSDSSMAIVSQGGDVSIVKLSGPCLKGKSPQISIRPSRDSDTICKKRDIEDVINGQLQQYIRTGPLPQNFEKLTMDGECVVTDYYYVGHLDADGFIVDDNGKRIDGEGQP